MVGERVRVKTRRIASREGRRSFLVGLEGLGGESDEMRGWLAFSFSFSSLVLASVWLCKGVCARVWML